MKIVFEVPLPENISLNKLLNQCWQQNMRVKDAICSCVYLSLCEHLGCGFPQLEKVKVRYTLYASSWQDLDNAEYGVLKIFNDCIVRSGLVKNDRPSHLTWERPEIKVSKGERKVVVELEVSQRKKGRERNESIGSGGDNFNHCVCFSCV